LPNAVIDLTPERALIFRITHIANVPWILDNGLHCQNSDVRDPNFRRIGNLDLIAKRPHRVVPIPPGGTLSDYIPFYFTPCSPMLYNIKTGYQGVEQLPMSEIVVLVSSLHRVTQVGAAFVFTDRHAYLQTATPSFSSRLEDLHGLDWASLRARDFRRVPDDPGKIERYQAEVLVHRRLPVSALAGLVCYGTAQRDTLEVEITHRGLELSVVTRPGWFF
jgi:hypothetical protein